MSVPEDHRLETKRCILRFPSKMDAPSLFSAFTSEFFPKYVPLGRTASMEEVHLWIEGAHQQWCDGEGYTWTAERKLDGTLVGQATVTQMDEESTWALAFWTHPDCWGEGFATEIAQCAIEFAFQDLSATRIWAAAATWNEASIRVLEKLEMKYLDENQEGYWMNNEPIPTVEFAIDRS
jgi:ribosomal-protein-alanine N-acetyltransferase